MTMEDAKRLRVGSRVAFDGKMPGSVVAADADTVTILWDSGGELDERERAELPEQDRIAIPRWAR